MGEIFTGLFQTERKCLLDISYWTSTADSAVNLEKARALTVLTYDAVIWSRPHSPF